MKTKIYAKLESVESYKKCLRVRPSIMKRKILIALILYLFSFNAFGQATAQTYRDFVVIENHLWAITNAGRVRLFDITQTKPHAGKPFGDPLIAVAIAKDIHSALII